MLKLSHVCGVAAISPLSGIYPGIQENGVDKELLPFISGKMEWESLPSILVTKNPN